jgi:hypothetical protein
MQAPAYAPDEQGREVEQQIIIEILRSGHDTPWSRNQLADRLEDAEPGALDNALDCLVGRGIVRIEDNIIEASEGTSQRDKLDALSGVVVHVLVSEYPQILTLAKITKECERNLTRDSERHEIELALRWITGDELARRQDDGWIATRPAVRAAELSF